VQNKTTDDDDQDTFNYLVALAKYYDGKYKDAMKIVDFLMSEHPNDEKFKNLHRILNVIENDKEKANEVFKKGRI